MLPGRGFRPCLGSAGHVRALCGAEDIADYKPHRTHVCKRPSPVKLFKGGHNVLATDNPTYCCGSESTTGPSAPGDPLLYNPRCCQQLRGMVLLFAMLCLACMCEGQARLSTAALRMQWFHVAQPPRFKLRRMPSGARRKLCSLLCSASRRLDDSGKVFEAAWVQGPEVAVTQNSAWQALRHACEDPELRAEIR